MSAVVDSTGDEMSDRDDVDVLRLPTRASTGKRRFPYRALRWPALVLGLVAIGAGTTYLVAPPVAAPAKVVVADTDSLLDGETDAVDVAGSMPSLTGLTIDTVRLALRDAGAPDVEVVTSTAPAAGPTGVVVTQQPAAGGPIGERVELVLSRSVSMPDVVGLGFDEASDSLEELGAVVRAETVIRPALRAGSVLASDPPAGSPVPSVVTLTVADPGAAVSLTDLSTTDSSGCYDDVNVAMTGMVATSALVCEPFGDDATYAVYSLQSRAIVLAFTAGIASDSGAGTGSVRVIGDGVVLADFSVTASPTRQVVDVSDRRRIRIEVSAAASGSESVGVVLGNAVVRGLPDDIEVLAGQ